MLKLLETLKDSAESSFDSAALRVENVHRLIGGYVGARARLLRGQTKPEATPAKSPDDASIYDVIRGVNREIGEFGTDMFEIIDDARARREAEKQASSTSSDRDD